MHKQERRRQTSYHYQHLWTSLVPLFHSTHRTGFSWGVRLQNLAESEHLPWLIGFEPCLSHFILTFLEIEALLPCSYSLLQHNTYEANPCLRHILELICSQLILLFLINTHRRILDITMYLPPCAQPHSPYGFHPLQQFHQGPFLGRLDLDSSSLDHLAILILVCNPLRANTRTKLDTYNDKSVKALDSLIKRRRKRRISYHLIVSMS